MHVQIAACFVISFSVFFGSSIYLIGQFKILEYDLNVLSFEADKSIITDKKLRKCVMGHQSLIKIIAFKDDIYSITLFCQICCAIFLFCFLGCRIAFVSYI